MDQVTLLRQTLQPHLAWHGARLNFLAMFLIALFRVKTVNLTELATGFVGRAQTDSYHKRLQRFFRKFELNYYELAKVVVSLMNIPEPWILSLDRTNWQFGQTTFNILTLGIVHQGVAFPVLWWMLDKKGNSNTVERIELIEELRTLFPERKIAYLTADREFLGQAWFGYLLKRPTIPFRIRIRASDCLNNGRQSLKASVVFQHLKPKQTQILSKRRRVWGYWLYVAALRLEDNDLLVVVTPSSPLSAIADYAARWGIETLFGIFKTRGFCLESTHFADSERLSKLFAPLTLALCWAFRTGQWLHEIKPLKLKKHGRKAKSLFRYGFDYLPRIVLNLEQEADEFLNALKFLSCT
jgi:hypothetical protein